MEKTVCGGKRAGLAGRDVAGDSLGLRLGTLDSACFACLIAWCINAVSACFFVVCSLLPGSTDLRSAWSCFQVVASTISSGVTVKLAPLLVDATGVIALVAQ